MSGTARLGVAQLGQLRLARVPTTAPLEKLPGRAEYGGYIVSGAPGLLDKANSGRVARELAPIHQVVISGAVGKSRDGRLLKATAGTCRVVV